MMRELVAALSAAWLMSFSFSAVAGSWVANGRSYTYYEETIQPYAVSYSNMCHGNIPGNSGGGIYGDISGDGDDCPDDVITGWHSNKYVTGGQCRPEPTSVGGGWSCVDKNYAINGIAYDGALPATCSVIGQYAVDSTRTVNLIYYGNGNSPDDYYQEINVFAREYRCI